MQLRVKVKPASAKDEVIKTTEGYLIKIKERPVEGKANAYLCSYLSKITGVPKSHIQVVKGETSAYKTLEITTANEALVLEKLSGCNHL